MIGTRRAVSLLELLVVMSACTVVLTLTSVLIVRAMRIQTQTTAYGDAERSALRLSDQFRADVHRARSAKVEEPGEGVGPLLRLESADGQQVSYFFERGIVQRSVLLEGQRISYEEFSFPTACEFVARKLQFPDRVELTVAPPSSDGTEVANRPQTAVSLRPVGLHVEACIGRDRILAAAPQSEGNP